MEPILLCLLLLLVAFNTALLSVLLLKAETKQGTAPAVLPAPKVSRPVLTRAHISDSGQEARLRVKAQLEEQMRREFGELYEEN